MSESALQAQIREATGKGAGRKLRAAGRIPAVLYGRGRESVLLSLEPRSLERALSSSHAGMNTLFDLHVEGRQGAGETVVLVKDLQRNPVKGTLVHADLYQVDLSKTIEVAVPIHIVGTAVGVSLNGGILDIALREIEIECLPRAIPDQIDLDVSAVDIGESLHVRDIPLPAGVTLRSDPDLAVVSVVAPASEAEAAPAAAAEGAAPSAATPAETKAS